MVNKMLDELYEKPIRLILFFIVILCVISFIAGAIIF